MTPEDALKELTEKGIISDCYRLSVRLVIEAVKAKETRRCAARVKIWLSRQRRLTESQRLVYRELANDMLITGGLEAEG